MYARPPSSPAISGRRSHSQAASADFPIPASPVIQSTRRGLAIDASTSCITHSRPVNRGRGRDASSYSMGRQKALEARLHAFEIQAVVVDGVQQLVELGGIAGLVLVGRDAVAEIEVLNAADGERRFHGRDHQGNDGQLTGAGAGEFVKAVAVGSADRVRGQQHEEFAGGGGDPVEAIFDVAFPVRAGGEAVLVERKSTRLN